jgi:undecaprenyl diphosphate synthase
MEVLYGAIQIGVSTISAYAFSTENWRRSPEEVRFLMGFNKEVIRRRRDELAELGVRIRWAGRRPRLWRSVIDQLEDAEQYTRDNDRLTRRTGRRDAPDRSRRAARRARSGQAG